MAISARAAGSAPPSKRAGPGQDRSPCFLAGFHSSQSTSPCCIVAGLRMAIKLYPRTTLALLTAINFFNYIDRSVLFAVQPLVQQEFRRSDRDFGFLTTAF